MRIRNIKKLGLAAALFLSCGYALSASERMPLASTPAEVGMAESLTDSIDSIINDAIRQKAFPGAQVLIARHGKVVHNKSYGQITEGGECVTDSTVYDLASVSKAIGTLPGVMLAVDRGYIDVDAPLSKYITQLQGTDKESITVREALYHETGMPAALNMASVIKEGGKLDASLRRDLVSNNRSEEFPVQVAEGLFVGQAAMDTIMQRIYTSRLRPDKSYNYSCLNFALLKQAVQNATGVEFSHWCDSLLWKPLGLDVLGYRPKERLPLARIAPTEDDRYYRHQIVHGYVHDEMAAFLGGISGNAGLFSNAEEIARICQMLLNGGTYGGVRILKPETVHMFMTEKSPTCRRGLGFDKPDTENPENSPTTELANASTVGHLGFTGTVFWIDPQNDMIVIFLTNRVNPTRDNKVFARMNIRPEIMRQAILGLQK